LGINSLSENNSQRITIRLTSDSMDVVLQLVVYS